MKQFNKHIAIFFTIFAFVIVNSAMGQQTITGSVLDKSKSEPLPGANILIKGSSIGTSTNASGKFKLEVESLNDTLVVSFVGYKTETVALNGRTKLTIKVSPKAFSGQEVVVVGYGEQQKSNVTGAISSVSSAEIEDQPVQQVGQSLAGKVAGVQITQNSGKPGGSLNIHIRGAGTVNNSQPLYVIDGNPVASAYDLSPDQIKNIQVLKSASAAAIYGSRGANGVILITTKQGQSGEPIFDIKYNEGVQKVAHTIDLANGRQYAQIYNQALTNAGQDPAFGNIDTLGVGTDWQDALFRMAPMRKISVSASGGNDQTNYYINGGYFRQKGIVRGTDYNRLSFRINTDHTINPYLRIGENLSADYGTRHDIPEFDPVRSVLIQTIQMDPTVPVKYSNGNYGVPRFSNSYNPIAQVFYNHNYTNRPTVQGDAYIDVMPTDHLTYHSQFNLYYSFQLQHQFNPYYDVFSEQRNQVPSVTRNDRNYKNYTWQNTLTYDNNFGPHHIKVLAGITIQEDDNDNVYATGQGIPRSANTNKNLRYLNLTTSGQNVAGGAGSYGLLSYLGRINYNYKNTYLATINFRADGSSKFGANNKFGYFPSFSLGWRLSNEPFLSNINFINDLKIRGGWGEIGNQNSLANYAFANTVTNNVNYVFGETQSVVVGQAPLGRGNPNLKWETTKEYDVGLDFSGFHDHITISGDYYHKKTSDLLLRVPIAAYSGVQNAPFKNGGDILNKGYELSVGYQQTTSGGFYFNISGNVSHNINSVTRLSNSGAALFSGGYQSIGNISKTAVGHPIGSFFGYVANGIFQTWDEVYNHATQNQDEQKRRSSNIAQSNTAPGDIRFKDLNGDGVINGDDQTYIGNPNPKFNYGINASFKYEGVDLQASFQGRAGNDIFAAFKYYTQGSNFFNYAAKEINAWNGQGSTNTLPRLNYADPNNNIRKSTRYVEDGSYLRLQNIQLGYTLPVQTVSAIGINKIRIYVASQNLVTISGYDGYTPEVGSPGASNPLDVGIDRGTYPEARTFLAGINISI